MPVDWLAGKMSGSSLVVPLVMWGSHPPAHCVSVLYLVRKTTGLVTYSNLFCWLLTIKDQCKNIHFQQTHNQGLRQLFSTVSWDLQAWRSTPDSVLVMCRKQRTMRVEGPWRALCQLKKPFKDLRRRRGSCWEERKRKAFSLQGVIDSLSRQIKDFLIKGNR